MKKTFHILFFLQSLGVFLLIFIAFIVSCKNSELNDDIFGSAGDEIILIPILIPFFVSEIELYKKIKRLLFEKTNAQKRICDNFIALISGINILIICSVMFFSLYATNHSINDTICLWLFITIYIALFTLLVFETINLVIKKLKNRTNDTQ